MTSNFAYFQAKGLESASYYQASGMSILFFAALFLWKFPFTVSRGLLSFKETGVVEVKSATAKQLEVAGYTIHGGDV